MHGAVVLEGFPAFHFSLFPQFSFTRMTDVTTNRVTFRHQPGCSHHALGEILALNEHFSRVCRFQSLPLRFGKAGGKTAYHIKGTSTTGKWRGFHFRTVREICRHRRSPTDLEVVVCRHTSMF